MYLDGQILYNKVEKEFVEYCGFYELRKDSYGKKAGDFTVLMLNEGGEVFAPNTPEYWKDVTHILVKEDAELPDFCQTISSKAHDEIFDVNSKFEFNKKQIKILYELLESGKIYLPIKEKKE